ncbi:uncharacterized protein [Ptychodera flava]|uniref:uncharacterized protein n=1 Tax=Ptychodera flava TaxID=63121 RepID=UPI00396A0797
MAEAPRACTINPLNILFGNLAKSLNEDDVNEMKNLLRDEQVPEVDMDKLRSALDVFHHLKKHGDIDDNNLDLLLQLFEQMKKEPLKERVRKFQRDHSAKTGHENTKDEQSGQETKPQSLPSLNVKITHVLEEDLSLQEQKTKIELVAEIQKNELRKLITDTSKDLVQAVKDNDSVKKQELKDCLSQFRAIYKEMYPGSLVLVLQFLTEEDLQYFWQKYKDGTVEKGLSDIIIPTALREKARNAGYTIRLQVEIDEKQFIEVKRKMHAISAFPAAYSTTWCRDTLRDKWYSFVMDQIQDRQQASHLLEQSSSDPVIQALRQEEFFFPAIVSFWFENSFTLPPTVTKATEYAVIHHAEMYCKENDVEVENLREIVKARFNDIGKHLYEHISEENVGKLYPSWIDESISNLESHLFGLLTKSEDFYTFPGKYVYSYIIAVYFSNIIALSPHNIPMYIREERMKTLQTYLPYCFPYITGILGDKAMCFLKEVTTFSTMQTSVDIDDLVMVGNCLFESERPSVFARDIEKLVGQNHTLDLSTCTGISNQSIHSLSVILQHTSIISDIKLYSEIDEAFLSSEFKECLTNIMGDPLAVDRCKVRINNSHDFTVTAKLLRILPLLCKHATSRSGSDTTQQPVITSLTISSNVSMLEEIPTFAMEMFIKALSCMPHLEKLSLTGLGEKLCEQFLLCLSKETVSLNINTLCLAGNDLSWKHCRLLLDALNVLPCLTSLDLSRNSIGSLGCTILLPIKDEINVSVDGNNIAHGLLEILSSCTSREQLQTAGFNTLESLDDVADLMKSLESVRHIDCTKLSNSQFSKLCQNLSLLHNIVSIDLSGIELNQQIVLLLSERLKNLKELKKVDLSQCIVSRADLKVLLQHISLEVTDLNLSATNMSGLLLDSLKHFENLKHLNLSNNNLNSSDLVFWYIPMTVTHLNLSHNNLYNENFKKLKNMTKLEELDVSYNKLASTDIQSILKAISTSVTTLNISHNDLKEMHEPFEHLIQLKQLDLSNNDLDTCLNLSLSSSVTKLDLSHNQITDIGQSFNHLSQLIQLNLSHNKVKLSLHDILTNMPTKVRYLDFSSNGIEDVANVGNIISSFNDLQIINLGSNKFLDIGIKHLLNKVKSKDMAKINVSHNFTLIPHIIDYMPTVSINSQQDDLLLSEVESSSIYDHLMQVTDINVSGLSEEKCSGFCKSLMMLTNLSKLVMTKCCMTNVQSLSTSLKHLHALTELDLSNNLLDGATICDIVRALPTTLISLNLSHNMAEPEFNLKHLTKLVRLDLSHNSLELPMHSILSNISQKLEYLDVSFNKIKNVDELGRLLSDFSKLHCINMSSNSLGTFGVQKLFSEIENCDANCDIDVSHNLSGLQKIIPHITWQLPISASLLDFDRENLSIKDEQLKILFENIPKVTSVEFHKM